MDGTPVASILEQDLAVKEIVKGLLDTGKHVTEDGIVPIKTLMSMVEEARGKGKLKPWELIVAEQYVFDWHSENEYKNPTCKESGDDPVKPTDEWERRLLDPNSRCNADMVRLSSKLVQLLGHKEIHILALDTKLMEIIKEKNMFDKDDKRFAILDEEMQEIFRQKRVRVDKLVTVLAIKRQIARVIELCPVCLYKH